jgi:eukaryotic-like serine/threonine-protein kinase
MIGQSLSRYTIESQLGEGGMGIVFKARDTQLGRTVAIKILPADKIADPDRKRRFIQEARAASALNHPHIVTIYDVGADGDTDFIVMEYLAGTTLDRLVPATGLPVKQALGYAAQIADALAKAHDAGIVHRDLKPSNVMIEAGAVKILDFGIAKLIEADAESAPTRTVATEEGTTVGTPAYMSPEQAEGRPIDGRSDIFSLGSVLYEMATGRAAFDGQSRLSVLSKILNEEPTPPSQLRAAVPLELEKTILRCLRKDPARRFQTMADLKVALEDLVLESSVTAQRSVPARAGSFPRALALTALAAVLVATSYFTVQWWRGSPASEPMRATPLTSLAGVVRSPTLSPDGNHVVFTWTGAKQDNPDLYVQQIGAGSHVRLTHDPGNDHSPSWSPDGRAIAFLRRDPQGTNQLWMIPPLGGPERKLADIRPGLAQYRANSVSWCPDTTCVVFSQSSGDGKAGAVFAVAIDTLEQRQLTFPLDLDFDIDPAISPDGRSLLFRRDNTPFSGRFFRAPLKGPYVPAGDPVALTPTLVAGKASWTPDGREILFAVGGGLWRLDVFSGGTPTRLPFVGQDGQSPVIARTPDGRQRMVYLHSFSDPNVWRVDTPGEGAPASAPPFPVISSTRADAIPNVSPVDQRVVFLSNRSGQSEFWVADRDGANATRITAMGIGPGFARWSPDGKLITFHGDPRGKADVLVLPVSGGKPIILTPENVPNGGFPNFSRDGRSIYFTVVDKQQPRIWKMPAGGGAAIQVMDTAGTLAIESRDGRDLFYSESGGDRPSAVWRRPVAGGAPVKVVDDVVYNSFDVGERGLYYIARISGETGAFFTDRQGGEMSLQYFDFATRQSKTIARGLGPVGPGLSATPDGRMIFFTRIDSAVDELMLVENFR